MTISKHQLDAWQERVELRHHICLHGMHEMYPECACGGEYPCEDRDLALALIEACRELQAAYDAQIVYAQQLLTETERYKSAVHRRNHNIINGEDDELPWCPWCDDPNCQIAHNMDELEEAKAEIERLKAKTDAWNELQNITLDDWRFYVGAMDDDHPLIIRDKVMDQLLQKHLSKDEK